MTICNSNRISCERLKTVFDHWDKDKDNESYNKLKEIVCLNVCPLSFSETRLKEELKCNEITTVSDSRKKRSPTGGPAGPGQAPPDDGLGGMPTLLKAQYQFLALYMGLNERTRVAIGHQFDDFIKECTFLGSDCLNIRSFSYQIGQFQIIDIYFKAILKT